MHGAIEMENLCFKEGGQQGPQMLWVFWTLKSEDFLPLYAPPEGLRNGEEIDTRIIPIVITRNGAWRGGFQKSRVQEVLYHPPVSLNK